MPTGLRLVERCVQQGRGRWGDAGNGVAGVCVVGRSVVVGGAATARRNVISANGGAGVWILASGDGATVAGNYIGTDARGQSALGNGREGIHLDAGATNIGHLGFFRDRFRATLWPTAVDWLDGATG